MVQIVIKHNREESFTYVLGQRRERKTTVTGPSSIVVEKGSPDITGGLSGRTAPETGDTRREPIVGLFWTIFDLV